MNDTIQKLHKRISEKKIELRKRRAAIRAHEAKLTALFADVEALGSEPYTDGDWIFISLSGDKHKFLSFARVIRKHGFELPTIEKGATGFTKLESIGEGDAHVYVYFQFSSTQCRRVKTGTKMVEQEVYETVCDELMPYGEQPTPVPEPVNDIPF